MKKLNIRPYITGLLPLFIFAHFGHHVIGAMLRPLTPMIRTNFDLNYTQVGVLTAVFSVTGGIAQLPAGWLADRFGPRFMILVSVAGVALAGVFIGLSHSYVALIAFLVLAAILGGGYHPASVSSITTSVDPEHRGRALGLHLIGGSSTFWVVPLIAAPIAVAWNWRASYLALSLPVVVLGIVLFFLVRSREKRPVSQTAENISRVKEKIPWRKIAPFIIMSVASGTMLMSVQSYLSLFAVDELGVTEGAAAMLMSISPAVGFVAAPLGGYLADRFGGIKVLLVASFLTVPIVYLFGIVPTVAAMVVLMVAAGLVNFARMPTSESYIAGNTPEGRRGTVLGLYYFAGTEVPGLLTPVIGRLIDNKGFYYSFTISAAVTAVLVVVCALFLWRNRA